LFNISKAAQGIYLCVLQGVNIEAVFGRCGIFSQYITMHRARAC